MKILGAVLEQPPKQHCQFSPLTSDWPNPQCCLAGSSKTAPRILIFSSAECLSYVKYITTFALTFFGYIFSVLASVLTPSNAQ